MVFRTARLIARCSNGETRGEAKRCSCMVLRVGLELRRCNWRARPAYTSLALPAPSVGDPLLGKTEPIMFLIMAQRTIKTKLWQQQRDAEWI